MGAAAAVATSAPAATDSAEAAAGKSSPASKMEATAATWEHRGRGAWHAFPPQVAMIVEAAYSRHEPVVKFEINGEVYEVCFESMQQRCRGDASRTRAVRRIVAAATAEPQAATASTTRETETTSATADTFPSGLLRVVVVPPVGAACEVELPNRLAATIGDLRSAIEDKLLIPKAKQALVCGGHRWHGSDFPDELKILQAVENSCGHSGRFSSVVVVKVLSLAMLSAATGKEIARCSGQVSHARMLLGAVFDDATDARKALLTIDDLLSKASHSLDLLSLEGQQRERRRELLGQIEVLSLDVSGRKALLCSGPVVAGRGALDIEGEAGRAVPLAEDADKVDKWQEEVSIARALVEELSREADPAEARKRLSEADDRLSRAAIGLDSLQLEGEQRERRRDLLQKIDEVGVSLDARRAALREEAIAAPDEVKSDLAEDSFCSAAVEILRKAQATVEEAEVLLKAISLAEQSKLAKQKVFAADDLLSRAAEALDSVTMDGAQRLQRRELLRRIEVLGAETGSWKAKVKELHRGRPKSEDSTLAEELCLLEEESFVEEEQQSSDEVREWQADVAEAASLLASLTPAAEPEVVWKTLLLSDDLLGKAAEGLDGLQLEGPSREKRRHVLQQIQALEEDIAARRAQRRVSVDDELCGWRAQLDEVNSVLHSTRSAGEAEDTAGKSLLAAADILCTTQRGLQSLRLEEVSQRSYREGLLTEICLARCKLQEVEARSLLQGAEAAEPEVAREVLAAAEAMLSRLAEDMKRLGSQGLMSDKLGRDIRQIEALQAESARKLAQLGESASWRSWEG